MSSLPPCTQVTYDATHLESIDHKTDAKVKGQVPVSLSFTDANGTTWLRDSGGLVVIGSRNIGNAAWLTMPEKISSLQVCGQAAQ